MVVTAQMYLYIYVHVYILNKSVHMDVFNTCGALSISFIFSP